MKPDWKDAPEWAQWLAMDGDGTWCWHEQQPTPNRIAFYWEAPRGAGKAWAGEEHNDWESRIEPKPTPAQPASEGQLGASSDP